MAGPPKKVDIFVELGKEELVAFQALAQAVTVQANQAATPQQQEGDLAAARICDVMRMSSPEFYGLKAGENPQLYLEKIRKITQYEKVVSGLVMKEYRTAMLNKEMDLSRLIIYAQQIEEDKIRERDRARGNKRAGSEQSERPQQSVSNKPNFPPYAKCGRTHSGEYLAEQRGFFGCGKIGQRLRE
ncbi:uncharacterized protein LOC124889718 [Capsicum annuum]|uniref:uncharacterized protein LOC124889718 n=1 Tax=Capsicum annuum TaxID=4072 RepID=UPI001FB1747C|nr:uncharacterized protein LOC124889718 [Capsicum annuum]